MAGIDPFLRRLTIVLLALAVVMAGAVNGSRAHVAHDHHDATAASFDAGDGHGHAHDDEPVGVDDEGDRPRSSLPSHDGAHHHVVDVLTRAPSDIAERTPRPARLSASARSVVIWGTWPPDRPPRPSSMSEP